jgi:tripeptide aminopeptidase
MVPTRLPDLAFGHWQQRWPIAVLAMMAICAVATQEAAVAAEEGSAASSTQSIPQLLLSHAGVKAALAQLKQDDARTLQEQIEIAQIPAPPFKEAVRAKDFQRRLRELGVSDVTIDTEGNVIARRRGDSRGPTLVLSAHLDTVFAEGTDVTVKTRGKRYYGPGLGDDARGLAVVLSVLRSMQANAIRTKGDVWFVGTVGEEALGNLRGVTALFRDNPTIDGFISVDVVDAPDGRSELINQATGVRRWEITFTGPGGHSFNNFGSPSAVHATGRAIAGIADLRPPGEPKTTFTVGVVSGGTSVNAIAREAQMQIDLRSNDAKQLTELERRVLALVEEAAKNETARWNHGRIDIASELIGNRPAASPREDAVIVQASLQAAAALGMRRPDLAGSSTDANVPMSLGIPAIAVSGGGRGDQFHSLDEWYEPTQAWLGAQSVLLTVLALVGVQDVSEPMLVARGKR